MKKRSKKALDRLARMRAAKEVRRMAGPAPARLPELQDYPVVHVVILAGNESHVLRLQRQSGLRSDQFAVCCDGEKALSVSNNTDLAARIASSLPRFLAPSAYL